MEHNNPYDNWRKRQTYYDRKEQESGETIKNIVKTFLLCLAFALLGWLLSGCTTTKYVPVIENHTDTLRVVQHHRDSIYLHDSTFVREFVQGDTVSIITEMWHTQYRDRLKTDTVYRSKVDSVPVPYPVEKTVKVEKPLTWWQQARLHLADIMLMLLAIFAGYKLWKYRKKILP
jgi:hypothetical protein